jgi:hypothetical protein
MPRRAAMRAGEVGVACEEAGDDARESDEGADGEVDAAGEDDDGEAGGQDSEASDLAEGAAVGVGGEEGAAGVEAAADEEDEGEGGEGEEGGEEAVHSEDKQRSIKATELNMVRSSHYFADGVKRRQSMPKKDWCLGLGVGADELGAECQVASFGWNSPRAMGPVG